MQAPLGALVKFIYIDSSRGTYDLKADAPSDQGNSSIQVKTDKPVFRLCITGRGGIWEQLIHLYVSLFPGLAIFHKIMKVHAKR